MNVDCTRQQNFLNNWRLSEGERKCIVRRSIRRSTRNLEEADNGYLSPDPGHSSHFLYLPYAIPPNPQSKPLSKGQEITLPTRLLPNVTPTKAFVSQSLIKSVLKQNEVIISPAGREERKSARLLAVGWLDFKSHPTYSPDRSTGHGWPFRWHESSIHFVPFLLRFCHLPH